MTSNPDDDFLAGLLEDAALQGVALEWSTPNDLARRSRETLAARIAPGRPGTSRGELRLAGSGVVGHSIRLSDLGGVLSSFQRTVSAVGGALDGITSSRGSLPASLVQRTNLRLDAAPAPGSVRLAITPEQSPAAELYPNGEVPLDDTSRPLSDRSLEEVIRLLRAGATADPTAREFRAEFAELGPRAASAVRAFLKIVADDDLDLNLSWQEPRRPTISAAVTSSEARFLEQVIANNGLDDDELVVRGTVHTVSDRRPLDLEVAGAPMRVQLGDQLPPDIHTLNVGDVVDARINVTTEQRAGGDEVVTYTLISIERVDEP
ncbi:hypothetical protein V2J52_16780 [Georgenia sp. MJ173]|uniref:hypothetical protein n=1 Tax=Georgenia sunbinii TaxID=3117728 RepID=UPI002F264132